MIKKIPAAIRAKILRWAHHNLIQNAGRLDHGNLHLIGEAGSEAFIHIDRQDYYVLARRAHGEIDIQIRALKTLDDLPAVLPEDVPADIYCRLEKRTRPNKGWIRRSQP